MLSKISVSRKLLLIYVLDMIAVVFLSWVLVEEKYISINFARKELVGEAYLAAIRDTLFAVTELGPPSTDGHVRLMASIARLAAAEAQLGADLESGPLAEKALASARQAAGEPALAAQAVSDLRALIGQVGDASNLILDPDLDSYYAMSLVVLRFPELVETLARIDAQMHDPESRREDLLVLEGRLDTVSTGLANDLKAGVRGNPDGTLAPAVEASFLDLDRALGGLRTDIRGAVNGTLGRADVDAFGGKVAAILAIAKRCWGDTANELDLLLQRRIDGLFRRMVIHFSLAGGILAIILTLVLWVAGHIARPIIRLADLADLVRRTNDYTLRAVWRSGDEIGRLVEAFNTMLERLQTEKEREQELAARARAAEAQRHMVEAIPTPLVVLRKSDLATLHANRPASDLMAEDWLPTDKARLTEECEFEAQVIGRDGSPLWALISARALNFQNEQAVLVTVVPITERRRMEEELRGARDRAEGALADLREAQNSLIQAEKLASLGGLVAGVAHEINTPVGVGLTAASILANQTTSISRLYANDDMGQADFEDFLKVAGETAELLLNNMERAASLIQSFKQVAVDRVSAERRRFALAEYIDEVLNSLHPTMRKTRIAVDVQCPANLELDGYPGALSQVLTNLVINAVVHAFDDGAEGRIAIIIDEPEPGIVRLVFADDGKGIPPDNMGRIFDPFFTTRRSAGGSGLGLHIVYNLVTGTLAGQIAVTSNLGRGTAFTLNIPRVAAVSAAE
jgi:signal transduction histidine kinase